MSGRHVAKRYARALYEVAEEKKIRETVAADIAVIEEIMRTAPAVRTYCLKKHTERLLEIKFVTAAFMPQVSDVTGRVLMCAVKNGRLAALPFLPCAFKEIQDQKAGIADVLLESAGDTEARLQKTIKTKMAKNIGGTIRLRTARVPNIVGGIRILWENTMIDLSVAGRLRKLRLLMRSKK